MRRAAGVPNSRGVVLNDEVVSVYYAGLKDLETDAVAAAFLTHVKDTEPTRPGGPPRGTFFPSVADLRRHAAPKRVAAPYQKPARLPSQTKTLAEFEGGLGLRLMLASRAIFDGIRDPREAKKKFRDEQSKIAANVESDMETYEKEHRESLDAAVKRSWRGVTR